MVDQYISIWVTTVLTHKLHFRGSSFFISHFAQLLHCIWGSKTWNWRMSSSHPEIVMFIQTLNGYYTPLHWLTSILNTVPSHLNTIYMYLCASSFIICTRSYLPHGLCVVLGADLQTAHPVLSLFGIGGWETHTKPNHVNVTLRCILLSINFSVLLHLGAANGKHPDQYCMMDGDDSKT